MSEQEQLSESSRGAPKGNLNPEKVAQLKNDFLILGGSREMVEATTQGDELRVLGDKYFIHEGKGWYIKDRKGQIVSNSRRSTRSTRGYRSKIWDSYSYRKKEIIIQEERFQSPTLYF